MCNLKETFRDVFKKILHEGKASKTVGRIVVPYRKVLEEREREVMTIEMKYQEISSNSAINSKGITDTIFLYI